MLGIEKYELKDVCNISRGKVISKETINNRIGIYPVYSSQTENNGELGKIDTYDYEGEFVTWTTDGAKAGTPFYRCGKFNVTNVCGLLKPNNETLNAKYLFYALQTQMFKYVNRTSANAKLMSNVVEKIQVTIPPLFIQQKIVATLDKFEEISNDTQKGLQLNIQQERKRYEYYRNKLLTFKEKS